MKKKKSREGLTGNRKCHRVSTKAEKYFEVKNFKNRFLYGFLFIKKRILKIGFSGIDF